MIALLSSVIGWTQSGAVCHVPVMLVSNGGCSKEHLFLPSSALRFCSFFFFYGGTAELGSFRSELVVDTSINNPVIPFD